MGGEGGGGGESRKSRGNELGRELERSAFL